MNRVKRFILRVISQEVSGPPGRGSRAEREAKVPRPRSSTRIQSPVRDDHEEHKKYEFRDGCRECDEEFTEMMRGSQGIQG